MIKRLGYIFLITAGLTVMAKVKVFVHASHADADADADTGYDISSSDILVLAH